jgi:dephospho-CoA kinase
MKILLAGKRGSGKDEAAMFLKKQYGGQITR